MCRWTVAKFVSFQFKYQEKTSATCLRLVELERFAVPFTFIVFYCNVFTMLAHF